MRDAGRFWADLCGGRSKAGELRPGDIINGYEFVELKQKGVEPGFVGLKAFTDEHMAQMRAAREPPFIRRRTRFWSTACPEMPGRPGLPDLNPAVAVLRSLRRTSKGKQFPALGEADFPNPK